MTLPVNFRLCILALLLPVFATPAHAAGGEAARSWLIRQGYAAPTTALIVACHGYGCTRRLPVAVDSAGLEAALAALRRGNNGSAAAERQALGNAIGIYTRTLARRLGGRPDVPRSPPSLSGVSGQMDCLDVTANTVSFLLVLQQRGLLVHHRVDGPQSRGIFLDGRYPHYTAVISDTDAGKRWAIDPWPRAPGQRPEVLPLERWLQAG